MFSRSRLIQVVGWPEDRGKLIMKKRISWLALLATSSLLVACGGNESSSDSSMSESPTTDASGSETTNSDDGLPDFGYEGGTFIKVFEDNDIFSTLLAAVTEAELTDLLNGDEPFTFFAPANKAFEDLPDGVLEKLLKPENSETLLEILRYHLVEGSLPTLEMTSGDLVSLQGSPISVEVAQTDNFMELLKVNGKFSLIPNMEATNGTIHVINWIMLPPGIDLDSL
jgi:uncharacterized surface protein with fasciclin (FAS1) repeats